MPSFTAARAPGFALGYGVVLALFATSPLWLGAVGLYQYLALEVLIWSLYALGYNLLARVTAVCLRSVTALFSASVRTQPGLR